ncbi:hypothetical protein P154DRAFT_612672 [Amniculicola lignicola CBS 123094]|uniref:Peptidase A1 domain-containing protein n=1 Tax=Amniculicola lignicola CBS 123094 TaxID=1392246 RepID=A0A6A5W1U3_9PLEO|nr:hypothetical protein P154DRAFT_612672 [Amniculicola lignicola CBS 123094]
MEIQGQEFEEATEGKNPAPRINSVWNTALGLSLFPVSVGMGWNFTTPSLFHSMIEQHLLRKNLFTLRFPRTDSEVGEITLGDLPRGLRWQDMAELPLDLRKPDDTYGKFRHYGDTGWQISLESMSMFFDFPWISEEIPILPKPQLPSLLFISVDSSASRCSVKGQ